MDENIINGGSGTIGKKLISTFENNNEIVNVSRNSKEIQLDISNQKSIYQMFEKIGVVDAIICVAGEAKWTPFTSLTEDDFYIGIRSKLMGK